ncbi:hypothetical protein HY991_06060 [Candidatus Micrarchaeota archaeon]|nr:hypothetical protein [Candidatus Micrarchaeota archaeon]
MARIEAAVFDAGPLIHLQQINSLGMLSLFKRILVSEHVCQELRSGFHLPKNCFITDLAGESKDLAKLASERYDLGLGEASAIALAKQERIKLLFTDDLTARDAAKRFGLEPHGTLAILTRAYRENMLGKRDAISCLEKLHSDSNLYLTRDLVDWARKQIESYRK